jgi:hypothetical protein
VKYLVLLILAACSAPQYKAGDCAATKIHNDVVKVLQVRDFVYYYSLPPRTEVLILRHNSFERSVNPIKCPGGVL